MGNCYVMHTEKLLIFISGVKVALEEMNPSEFGVVKLEDP